MLPGRRSVPRRRRNLLILSAHACDERVGPKSTSLRSSTDGSAADQLKNHGRYGDT